MYKRCAIQYRQFFMTSGNVQSKSDKIKKKAPCPYANLKYFVKSAIRNNVMS